jgi:hypothetical protein
LLTAWLPTFDVNAIELPNGHRKNCIGHFDQDVTVIINETERMIESVILFATEKFFSYNKIELEGQDLSPLR